MDGWLDVVLNVLLAPFRLWRWAEDRRQARAAAERRVRLEVVAANRRLAATDREAGASGPDRPS